MVATFTLVGIVMNLSMWVSKKLAFGRVYGLAVAIMIGLVLAYWSGMQIGGERDLADLKLSGGVGLMDGATLCSFAIMVMAPEVQVTETHKAGMIGAVSLLLGAMLPFIVGACAAYAFGYTGPMSVAAIGVGAITYIVGPATGAALGTASDMMALPITTGLVKAILMMVGMPFAAKTPGLDNPRAAMVFSGLVGTASGASADLAATDRRLAPCNSLVATFHAGLSCLLRSLILFLVTQALLR